VFIELDRLTYSKALMSVGILEGDSSDSTYDDVLHIFEAMTLKRQYRRLTLVRKDFKGGNRDLNGHNRHAFAIQGSFIRLA
jgi:hypothetical protein